MLSKIVVPIALLLVVLSLVNLPVYSEIYSVGTPTVTPYTKTPTPTKTAVPTQTATSQPTKTPTATGTPTLEPTAVPTQTATRRPTPTNRPYYQYEPIVHAGEGCVWVDDC